MVAGAGGTRPTQEGRMKPERVACAVLLALAVLAALAFLAMIHALVEMIP